MFITDKVKIGCYEYEVTQQSEPLILDAHEMCGVISYENNTIRLNNKRSAQRIEQTFWHEVIHGICYDRGLEINDDENVVEELAKGFYQFIKDNKQIFKSL
jgi:hypothetical protein